MAFEEDFTLFFDDTEFAVAATATTRLGAALQLKVIFDAPHVDGLDGARLETCQPEALAPSNSVQGLTHGDPITINGKAYVIVGVKPDGTGVTRLILERAS